MKALLRFVLWLGLAVAVVAQPIRPWLNPGVSDPRDLTGLAAWYDTSDTSSLYNSSNATPATSGDAIKLIADKSGNSTQNCLLLPGVAGNYASFTALTAFGTGNFSISVKVLVASRSGASSGFLGGANNSFGIRSAITTGLIAIDKIGASSAGTSAAALPLLTDAVVGYTRSGTTGKIYVNGVLTDTITDSQNYTVGVSEAGSFIGGTNSPLNGNLKWARVYSVALDAAAMAADAAGTVQANCVLNIDWTSYGKLAASPITAATGQTVTINQTAIALPARIHGERDLYQGLAASQPVYLPYAGVKYGYFPSLSGQVVTAPNIAAYDITGDVELVVLASTNFATNSGLRSMLNNWGGAGGAYALYLSGANVQMWVRSGGTNYFPAVAHGLSDGETWWLKASRVAATGLVTFSKSTDGVTWTTISTPQATVAGNIDVLSRAIFIGTSSAGTTDLFAGRIYRAQIYNGIGGTLAFDFNPATYTSGTTFTDSSSNAATITLNGGATIVTRTCIYFDGTADYMKTAAFSYAQPESVYFVGSQVSWTGNDDIFDGNATALGQIYQWSSSPNLRLFAGVNGPSITTLATQTPAVLSTVFNGASSLLRLNRTVAATGDAGSSNMGGFTLAGRGDGTTQYANITASEIILRSAADATATQDAFILYEQIKWKIW